MLLVPRRIDSGVSSGQANAWPGDMAACMTRPGGCGPPGLVSSSVRRLDDGGESRYDSNSSGAAMPASKWPGNRQAIRS